MKNALIGFSGFVGSTLLKQSSFESLYRSTNISEIAGQSLTRLCVQVRQRKSGLRIAILKLIEKRLMA